MSERYENFINNKIINFIWLLLIYTSASFGITAFVIWILAVTNVQILSWSIGYVLLSGTNEMIMTPSIVITLLCAAVFILCMFKNRIFKVMTRK